MSARTFERGVAIPNSPAEIIRQKSTSVVKAYRFTARKTVIGRAACDAFDELQNIALALQS